MNYSCFTAISFVSVTCFNQNFKALAFQFHFAHTTLGNEFNQVLNFF